MTYVDYLSMTRKKNQHAPGLRFPRALVASRPALLLDIFTLFYPSGGG
jgi:hypothetical protein